MPKRKIVGYKLQDRIKRTYTTPDGDCISRHAYESLLAGVPAKRRRTLYETETYERWEIKFRKMGRKIDPFSKDEREIRRQIEAEKVGDKKGRENARIALYKSLGIMEPWMLK